MENYFNAGKAAIMSDMGTVASAVVPAGAVLAVAQPWVRGLRTGALKGWEVLRCRGWMGTGRAEQPWTSWE